jgi:uncharacterized protein (UPF0332 family)
MKSADFLNRKIADYLKKKQLLKSSEYKKLEKPFLAKSRKNFTVANMMFKLSEQDDLRKVLKLASDFEMYDWAIIASYYAMYTSALGALAKLGFKSKSHAATIAVLERHYALQKDLKNTKTLEHSDIHKLVKAYSMSEHLITKLLQTKTKRETAQYDATSAITREMAKTSLNDADEFITKIEGILA